MLQFEQIIRSNTHFHKATCIIQIQRVSKSSVQKFSTYPNITPSIPIKLHNRLMLFTGKTVVYCNDHKKRFIRLCGKKNDAESEPEGHLFSKISQDIRVSPL